MDRVSVIIPTYNRERTILRAIDSVLKQEFDGEIEIIVVNDASTDCTENLLKETYGNKIRIITLERNGGACFARNIGIEHASFDYISFCDSDDEWRPNKLDKQIRALKEQNADIVASSFVNYKGNRKILVPKDTIDNRNLRERLFRENFITTSTILGKKSCFTECMFNTAFPRFQDWELMIRLTDRFDFFFIQEPLCYTYATSDSITNNPDAAIQALLLLIDMYRDYLGQNKMLMKYMYKKLGSFSIEGRHFEKNYYRDALAIAPTDIKIILHIFRFYIHKIKYKISKK